MHVFSKLTDQMLVLNLDHCVTRQNFDWHWTRDTENWFFETNIFDTHINKLHCSRLRSKWRLFSVFFFFQRLFYELRILDIMTISILSKLRLLSYYGYWAKFENTKLVNYYIDPTQPSLFSLFRLGPFIGWNSNNSSNNYKT